MLITNGTIITWEQPNRILEGHALLIQGKRIAALGPRPELERAYPNEERLDARGQYVMPGNICAHTHFYGAFARGMAIPGAPPKDFPEILQKLWWPLDRSLDAEAVRLSACVMIADAIKHGTTTLVDHHASPNAIEGSLDVIADACQELGMRALVCYGATERNGGRAEARDGVRFRRRPPR